MHSALVIVAIAATVLIVTGVAARLKFSAPLLLMLVGIGLSFVPHITAPALTPEIVLVGFLPPLLYAAAIRSSVVDFRVNLRPIAFLSVLLVVITALGIGLLTWLLLPVPFAAAFAFGAVVAPPDAVAATSIARGIGLPRRLITILEGESLLNDATAITCLRVALAALAGAVGIGDITLGFAVAAVGGVLSGIVVAFVAVAIRRRVQNPVFDTAISFLIPFAAYLPAEELQIAEFHGSGVIAVVVAGLILGHKSPRIQNGQSRLSERNNWTTIQFVLENTVFLLIGLQARRIIDDVDGSPGRIAAFCLAALAGVIILRIAWLALARISIFRRDPRTQARAPWSEVLVVGWAGLRGVVTLAAAFLIPEGTAERGTLILGAMVITAGTLLVQGLTLPSLVRALKLRGPDARSDALQAATVLQTAANAALAELDEVVTDQDAPETVNLVRDRIGKRPDAVWEQLGRSDGAETPTEQYRRLRLVTLHRERAEVLSIRNGGTVDHDVIAEVLTTLDVEESMLTAATQRSERLLDEEPMSVPTPTELCDHLHQNPVVPDAEGDEECQDCVRENTRPVHLRICLDCHNVGCCDSSVGRHAERHFQHTGHAVMESYEPNETWRWCYLDERLG